MSGGTGRAWRLYAEGNPIRELTQDELDALYKAKQECDRLGIPFLIPDPDWRNPNEEQA